MAKSSAQTPEYILEWNLTSKQITDMSKKHKD